MIAYYYVTAWQGTHFFAKKYKMHKIQILAHESNRILFQPTVLSNKT